MIRLNVPDMSCGHCAGAITKALKALDANAQIDFDMPKHMVQVRTAQPLDEVVNTLAAAGYPATPEKID